MKKSIRISIRLLLFITFCAAGFFTGFRYGLSDGLDAQVDARLADRESQIYLVIYHVSDTRPSPPASSVPDVDSLIKDIKRAVGHRSWKDSGGPCTIVKYPPDRIVASASREVHSKVAAYLAGWREGNRGRAGQLNLAAAAADGGE